MRVAVLSVLLSGRRLGGSLRELVEGGGLMNAGLTLGAERSLEDASDGFGTATGLRNVLGRGWNPCVLSFLVEATGFVALFFGITFVVDNSSLSLEFTVLSVRALNLSRRGGVLVVNFGLVLPCTGDDVVVGSSGNVVVAVFFSAKALSICLFNSKNLLSASLCFAPFLGSGVCSAMG